jgi:hypothetical protein
VTTVYKCVSKATVLIYGQRYLFASYPPSKSSIICGRKKLHPTYFDNANCHNRRQAHFMKGGPEKPGMEENEVLGAQAADG